MSNISDISQYNAEKVLGFFKELSSVPHGSGNTKAIADICVNFAKERHLDYRKDEVGNVIIFKKASLGAESRDTVIIQGHLDMVCVKTSDCTKNMFTDPIDIMTDGNVIWADKTSLGADDTVAIAIALAILDDDTLQHPPICAVFTVDEETGMSGAANIGLTKDGKKGGPVQGVKYLINIDNLTDGEIVVSTLGSVIIEYIYPKLENTEPLKGDASIYHIDVSGLIGGHDGLNIEGHVSAAYIVSEILKTVSKDPSFRLIEFDTPDSNFHNVIQKHAQCTFTSTKPENEINDIVTNVINGCKGEFPLETGITATVEPQNLNGIEIRPFSHEMSVAFIKFLNSLPFGILTWKDKETGWLESSGNFGPVHLKCEEVVEDGKVIWKNPSFTMKSHYRSCDNPKIDSCFDERKQLISNCFGPEANKITMKKSLCYGWEGNTDQTLVYVARRALDKRSVKWYNCNTRSYLEVSWFKYFNKDLSMISIGPEVHNMHDRNETLYVETTQNCLGVILECIEQMRLHKKAA